MILCQSPQECGDRCATKASFLPRLGCSLPLGSPQRAASGSSQGPKLPSHSPPTFTSTRLRFRNQIPASSFQEALSSAFITFATISEETKSLRGDPPENQATGLVLEECRGKEAMGETPWGAMFSGQGSGEQRPAEARHRYACHKTSCS